MVDNPYKIAGNILSASLESDYNFRSVDLYGHKLFTIIMQDWRLKWAF